MRCLNEADWPLVAKLHGDYQSIQIKNTGSELELQDARMREVLQQAGNRFGMVFVGYSGRDASVMDALNTILVNRSPFPNGLYWVTASASRLSPSVTEFLEKASGVGVDVAIVECATFDELGADIIDVVNFRPALLEHVMVGRAAPRLIPVKLSTIEARAFPILRYSALLIETMPLNARRLIVSKSTTSTVARELLKEKRVRATVAANGRELAAFGKDQDLLDALEPLGPKLGGEIALHPASDSWALGLLYDALVRALARRRPLIPLLKRSGHSLVVAAPREGEEPERIRQNAQMLEKLKEAYGSALTGHVPALGFPFQEGVFLKLDQVDGRWWCGFEPYTFVQLPKREESTEPNPGADTTDPDPMGGMGRRAGDPAGDWRRERWAQRYNRNWAAIIDAWADLLAVTGGGTKQSYGLVEGTGIDGIFEIAPVTGWSRPSHHHAYFSRNK
jgi:hypothetical protein